MSVQTARKVALAYWGFSSKPSSRAKSGIDIDIVKGNGGPGLESATAPLQRFAKLVEASWEDYTGQVGSYGRIPFETLLFTKGSIICSSVASMVICLSFSIIFFNNFFL